MTGRSAIPATAMEPFCRRSTHSPKAVVVLTAGRGRARSWPLVLPLLIGLALAALSAGSAAAGACSGAGLALADLPEAGAALREARG